MTRALFGAFGLLFAVAMPGPALAVTCQPVQHPPSPAEPDDAFGFLDGTALSDPCTVDVQTEIVGHHGKRDGRFTSLNSKVEATWLAAPGWMISVAFWHAFHAIRDNTVPGYPNHNRSAFDGAAVQVAYQFRERGEHAFDPGFSVGIETRYGKFSEGTAFSADRYSVAIKGAIDMALSGDRLYGAFNFSLGPGTERVRLTPGYVADSALELSLAATYRLTHGGNTFIGVNARYAASFSNAFYGRWSGHAVLAGPTLYHEFGTVGPLQYVFLSVAWTPQIWGRAAGGVTGDYDLVNAERQQFRLRIGGML
jgi:hypothetical protein